MENKRKDVETNYAKCINKKDEKETVILCSNGSRSTGQLH